MYLAHVRANIPQIASLSLRESNTPEYRRRAAIETTYGVYFSAEEIAIRARIFFTLKIIFLS